MGMLRRCMAMVLAMVHPAKADAPDKTENPNENIAVEAMLHGRSCCG